MSWLSNKIAVNLSDVASFKSGLENFSRLAYYSVSEMSGAIGEMADSLTSRLREAEETSSAFEALYSEIQQLKRSTEQRISALKSELSSTPEKLEKVTRGSDGTAKIKKEPNPAHSALENRIKKESARLCEIREMSYKVYGEVSHAKRVRDSIASSLSELKSIIPEVERGCRDVAKRAEMAECSVKKIINAVEAYLSYKIRG